MSERKSFLVDSHMKCDLETVQKNSRLKNDSAAIRFALALTAELVCARQHGIEISAVNIQTGASSFCPEQYPFIATATHLLILGTDAQTDKNSRRTSFVFTDDMLKDMRLVKQKLRCDTDVQALRIALTITADILCCEQYHGVRLRKKFVATGVESSFDPHLPLFAPESVRHATAVAS